MIGFLSLLLAQAEVPRITLHPLPPTRPSSRPQYDVHCELRDLDFSKGYRIALVQYGGVYKLVDGVGGRSPTFARFSRDDLGIFGDEELDLTGSRVTDWYADGPIELVAKRGAGAFTIFKIAQRQAFHESPTKVAVTAKVARHLRGALPEHWEEFMLVGSCDVSWESQEAGHSLRIARHVTEAWLRTRRPLTEGWSPALKA